MVLTTVVVWIIVGAVAGLLADRLVSSVSLGLGTAIIVGILGAFIGGWLFNQLGLSLGGGILGAIIVSFIGAAILLLIVGAIRRR